MRKNTFSLPFMAYPTYLEIHENVKTTAKPDTIVHETCFRYVAERLGHVWPMGEKHVFPLHLAVKEN